MILTIKNLDLIRSQKILIKNLCCNFSEGQIYALIGPNGSGKTTLLKTIAGLLPVKPDQIYINNCDVFSLPQNIRAQHISLLLQHSPFDPYTLAADRIIHGLIPHNGFKADINKKYGQEINNIIKNLRIEHLLNRPLTYMSGGEQRLVYLAKCLVNPHTKIFLLDEPTIYLDFKQKDNLFNIIKNLAFQQKIVIFSSHDREFINKISSHIINFSNNQAYFSAPNN